MGIAPPNPNPQSSRATLRIRGKSSPGQREPSTDDAELTGYFTHRYLAGRWFDGGRDYLLSRLDQIQTFQYNAADGAVQVWQYAFDLRSFSKRPEDVIVLYHYTDELGFHNIGNVEQMTAELFASLEDRRAHFGKGIYASRHEPAVWGTRLRILMNAYSNDDPLSFDPEEAEPQRVSREWGSTRPQGHRAAFCIPLIVPKDMAYNIFERHTPDMAVKRVMGVGGGDRPIQLGEDYKGRPVHRNRDVWVIRIPNDHGEAQHATATADSLLDVLQLQLRNMRRELGSQHLMTLGCMTVLARRLQGQHRHEEAERLYREALEGYKSSRGEFHQREATTLLINLSLILKQQHKLEEAEEMHRAALQQSRIVLGDHHINTLTCISNLAILLSASGRDEEAAVLHDECLEQRRAKLGDDHPHTLISMRHLSDVWRALGRLQEAEVMARACLQLTAAKLGKSHPETLKSTVLLASLLSDQGKYEEAEPMLREATSTYQAKLGKANPNSLFSLSTLAFCLQKNGKLVAAEVLTRESLELQRTINGFECTGAIVEVNNLAEVLRKKGELGEASPLHREALGKARALLGESHQLTMTFLSNRAKLLHDQGNLEEAERLQRKSLEQRRVKLGESHVDTAASMHELGRHQQARGHLEEAVSLLRQAREKRREQLGAKHPDTLLSTRHLAAALDLWGEPKEAGRLRQELESQPALGFKGVGLECSLQQLKCAGA